MKVSISKFVSKVISIPNQHIKDRVVKIEEDEIKIEIREEVENNSEQICNPCPAICKTSKSLLRHKMEVIYYFIKRKIRDNSHCKYHIVYTKQKLQVTISKYKK